MAVSYYEAKQYNRAMPLFNELSTVMRGSSKMEEIAYNGYRTVFNCNEWGGQTVYHLHLHLLGNRKFKWPPG